MHTTQEVTSGAFLTKLEVQKITSYNFQWNELYFGILSYTTY